MSNLAPTQSNLVQLARSQADALIAAEKQINDDLQALCARLWELGKTLSELKDIVSHGNWIIFVSANFPQLGKEEKTRVNRAADAKAFFEANPKFPDIGEFTVESIRKCVFHLAPEKERPNLPGDQPVAPHIHQLTFINNFEKWYRQTQIGLIKRPPVEELQRDLAPVADRLIELCGADWLKERLK